MKKKDTLSVFTRYVALNMLGMLGISCYILADTYFIANGIGTDALTALNLALPIFGIINGIGILLGIGSGTRYTILMARNKTNEAREVFSQTLIVASMVGIGLSGIGLLKVDTLCKWLGADYETFEMMSSYLKTILALAPFFILNHVLVCFVRNDQEPRLAMMAVVVGSMMNIVLDYIFVYILELGMFGAALATGIAPLISLGILSIHLLSNRSHLKFIRCQLKLETIKDSYELGRSACVTEVSSGIVLLVFNLIILALAGNTAVAAYGIIANISIVCLALFTGIAQGIQPLVSYYYGEQDLEKVKQIRNYGLSVALGLGSILYVGIYKMALPIIDLFNKEQDRVLTEMANTGISIYFIGILFAGVNIVGATYLSAVEEGREGFIIAMMRGLMIIIPSVVVFAGVLGLKGVWISFVVAEALTAGVTYRYLKAKPIGCTSENNLSL